MLKISGGVCIAFSLLASSAATAATDRANLTVNDTLIDNRTCFFFRIVGITQADPALASEWFSIPKSATNYQEMISMVLSSKLSGKGLHVMTDGTLSCGLATASGIGLD